jgi:hypothetical protein
MGILPVIGIIELKNYRYLETLLLMQMVDMEYPEGGVVYRIGTLPGEARKAKTGPIR